MLRVHQDPEIPFLPNRGELLVEQVRQGAVNRLNIPKQNFITVLYWKNDLFKGFEGVLLILRFLLKNGSLDHI